MRSLRKIILKSFENMGPRLLCRHLENRLEILPKQEDQEDGCIVWHQIHCDCQIWLSRLSTVMEDIVHRTRECLGELELDNFLNHILLFVNCDVTDDGTSAQLPKA